MFVSVVASRRAAAGERRDSHERGAAVELLCASPAHLVLYVPLICTSRRSRSRRRVTIVYGIFPPSIDGLGRRFRHILVDRQAVESQPSYFGQCSHHLISAVPTRRRRRVQMVPRTFRGGGGTCEAAEAQSRVMEKVQDSNTILGCKGWKLEKFEIDW